MIDSRKIEDLHPTLQQLAVDHMQICHAHGFDILIYCTYRDDECQERLYTYGRTASGSIITCARGGESAHNYRLAYDAVPIIGGKAMWSDAMLIRQMGIFGEGIGLEWAGRWQGKLKESVHFQKLDGLTIAELRSGKTIG